MAEIVKSGMSFCVTLDQPLFVVLSPETLAAGLVHVMTQ